MRLSFLVAVCVAFVPAYAFGLDDAPALRVQADAPATLLDRAETLDEVAVEGLLDEAFAAVGCTLPADLLSVFEIYLLDHAMTSLGVPIGPEVAQQGYFALSLRSTTIHHPEARAVLTVARALEGRVEAAIADGRLRLRQGLFLVEECVAQGTLFALSPYAR